MAEAYRPSAVIEVWESTLDKDEKKAVEDIKKKRRNGRSQVTKAVNSLNDIIRKGDEFDIQSGEETLRAALKNLDELDELLWLHMDDDTIDADIELSKRYSDPANTALASAKRALHSMTAPPPPPPSPPVRSKEKSDVKLPKLEVPHFAGKSPAEWQTFWNTFESLIEKRTEMGKIQKLIYLKGSCIEEAEKIADGYSLTADNYDQLVATLKSLYGNPRLIQQSHIENILNLTPFKSTTIQPFLTTLDTSLRCLAEFSINAEDLSPVIVPHIEKQMPKEIFSKWREKIHDDKSFSMAKLLSFLRERLQCAASNPPKESSAQKDEAKNKDAKPKTTAMLSNPSKEEKCICCERASHKLADCSNFKRMSVKERADLVNSKNHCFKCLLPCSKKHFPRICRERIRCETCNGYHNTLLHRDRQSLPANQPQASGQAESTTTQQVSASPEQVSANALHHSSEDCEKLTVLKNFQAKPKNSQVPVRSAIDDGSQKTWILSKTAKALKLPVVRRSFLAVATAFEGEFKSPQLYDVVKISLQTKTKDRYFEMEAIVSQSDKLTVDMDQINFNPNQTYPHLREIQFADTYPRKAAEVELLIGNDYADVIQTGRKKLGNIGEPVAVETVFGWVLSGKVSQSASRYASNNVSVMELGNALEKFWKIEEVPTPKTKMKTLLEEQVHNRFKETISYDEESKQYTVEIPYKDEVADLGENYVSTKMLFLKQQQKLNKNPEQKNVIHKIFAQQLDEGILEKITEDEAPVGQKHYLSWHTVLRPGHPTTPVRPVLNASLKDRNGLSLNAAQHVGPNLLPDLVGVILRFRSYEVAFVSDIKKMFWQLKIPDHQKDLHRIFTFDGLTRQTTVLFGESSSPFLAIGACHFHADRPDIQKRYPKATTFVKEQLYMDDIPAGSKTVQDAKAIFDEVKAFFASMHMLVHKVTSNSAELLAQIDGADNKEDAGLFGLKWNTKEDALQVPFKDWDQVPETKREFLRKTSTIWDPFGGHSPLVCRGKMILQKIWMEGQDWDTPLPPELRAEIAKFKEATRFALKIPRFFGSSFYSLHIFVDASEAAYATVAYVISDRGPHFLLSKTRVKPVKVVTLPRMELLGALLGSRLLGYLKEELFKSGIHTYMWTDSTIALGWILSPSSKYKPFVGNRISEIQQTSGSTEAQWRWVPGDQNPADIPSRGIWPLDDAQSKFWVEGPEFLKNGEWPEQPQIAHPELETRKVAVNSAVVQSPIVDFSRFSTLEKLVRTMVLILRFGSPLGGRNAPMAQQRKKAITKLIIQDQKSQFPEEYGSLQMNQPLSNKSRLLEFNPFIDEDGIIRMDGRVNKKLILLSDKSPLTKLIIREAHVSNLHTGANQTLAHLRQKYWILRGMAAVKSITKNCIKCKKLTQPLCQQFMADLPDFRKAPLAPFSHVGLDYAGPLIVKTKASPEKRWICLFTCSSTRGVHLEIVENLSTEQFLMAFSRFASRRGKPTHLYSDNATTFTKAAKNLPDIVWQFNPPAAPWWGGFWERLVASIKAPLKKILGKALVTDKELSTLIIRIEEQINSRPLTPLVDDPEQTPLTPADILIGRPFQQAETTAAEIPSLHAAFSARQKYLKGLQQSWTRRWVQEYLPSLQPRPKWQKRHDNLQPGCLVLLQKENQKRHLWPLAKIEEVHVGRDGHVRSATLRDGKNNVIRRPIQNLVLLEGAKQD